jgi:hypothetical protein
MLSIARSRYTLAAQFLFMTGNILGLVAGVIYNARTPDLYPNNAHHSLGWVLTIITGAHVFLHLLDRVTSFMAKGSPTRGSYRELGSLLPSQLRSTGHQLGTNGAPSPHRSSYESHEVGGLSDSQRSSSASTLAENQTSRFFEDDVDEEGAFTDVQFTGAKPPSGPWTGWISKVPMGIFYRGSRAFALWYNIIDRVILLLGFTALCTGVTTYGRFFVRLHNPAACITRRLH